MRVEFSSEQCNWAIAPPSCLRLVRLRLVRLRPVK